MTRPDPAIAYQRGRSPGFVSQRVLSELGRRILAGQYAQHSALPTELQLCAEFGVSRTAMREATKMLAAKGLVVSRKRAGTLVQDSSLWNRLDPDVLSWMSATDPDPEFVRGLIEARLAIEPAAAELAARRASAGDLARIEAGYLAMRAADLSDLAACAEADVAFHVSILNASHNPVFAGLASLIGQALENSFRLTTSVSRNYAETLDAHGDVLEAIRLRKPDQARARMRALIDIASADLVNATAKHRP
ncbi:MULTISPECIES: FadR/GntR family transcriptional regulator [unclassified Mesorhizobium]|uniref:FadR/GntR family transcriptional regulator n=1 Tax=unclassified Mesorhizobium TaxID=325217 RepID=UPI000FD94106|nr:MULTISPECIES: FadR/GntR family transcriptional regulator [unclassified Mesorhizobium]TGQ37236.1 FadR family transcriptional regulator [Mesorhizobium sp. M00.F.Ca.ET.216.01.1.1]TIS56668.1 MAG: FCD domain-containing protein [Mesorhizobium sp.]TJW10910.1 MAG: FCD domain-containing protein [Mesorhizobium sp.]TJW40695.1 MAG: FCD domain-containing protein [Mesorhizobium sp.]